MKKYIIIALSGAILINPINAIDLFNKTAKEMDTNFLRPLSDIKNTLENTVKIFQGIESPADRLRVSGGFMREMAGALDKLTNFIEYLNEKFINSILSKNAHAKVELIIKESHHVLTLLEKMGDGMRGYGLNEQMRQPQMRSEGLPKDFPVVSELDTE